MCEGGQEDMRSKHRGQKRKESRGFPTILWVLAWKTHGLRGSVTRHGKSAASLQPPHTLERWQTGQARVLWQTPSPRFYWKPISAGPLSWDGR